MHEHDVHFAFYARGQLSSAKQVSRFRKMVAVVSISNVKMGKTRLFEIELFFYENAHHMSRESSCHKISVCRGSSNVVSLAFVSSLMFFSVSCNAEYIQITQYC